MLPDMREDAYGDVYFASQRGSAASSARVVLPLVFQWTHPRSVVDVGCGIGTWLAAAIELGVSDVLGVDGSYVNPAQLEIPAAAFIAHDLEDRLALDRRFDLATCLEVAEHLPKTRSGSLIDDLC
jgi:2-polyprenyl-3-methyl-5-hydroxy-6-metoxy-1,4-benzoquinol methylase